jgi:hypothetical protein
LRQIFKIQPAEKIPGLELVRQTDFQPDGIQAWDWTILKWKWLLVSCSRGRLVSDGGRQTCGLCALYFFGHEDECEDCPIKLAGHPGCRGTPYRDYQVAVKSGDLTLARQAASREIEFLRSIRMGMDFSYLLYFKREQIWDALREVIKICRAHTPPAVIHFPDHNLTVPLDTWGSEGKEFQHNDPEFNFAIVINFKPDAAIQEYVQEGDGDDEHRSPPDPGAEPQVGIGFIYLTIDREFPDQPAADLVRFNFGTPGTTMSLLFEASSSIRSTFVALLERLPGICGVFNQELSGELFWWQGHHLSVEIPDPFMLPAEIEPLLGVRKS